MITKDQVLKVASLAFLRVEDERVDRLTENLNSILGYVQRLEKVEVKDIEPMSHVHGSTNVFRADEVAPSMPVEEALQNAPDTLGRFIRVPIIIGQPTES